MDVKIDKDPELFNLTAEARRLSMGGSARRTAEMSAGNEFSSGTSPAPPSSYNNNSLVPPPAPTGLATNANSILLSLYNQGWVIECCFYHNQCLLKHALQCPYSLILKAANEA